MATNFIQNGNTLTIPAPATVAGGFPVIAGAIVGIALGDAVMGAPVDVTTGGVFELPKVAIDDVALGDIIYWDDVTELATLTATNNTKLGVAVAAAGASTGTVKVRMSGF